MLHFKLNNSDVKINSQQIGVTIVSILFLIPVFVGLLKVSSLTSFIDSCFALILIYIPILRYLWVLGTPINNDIKFNASSAKLLNKGICPFCGKRNYSPKKIKVGYRKRYWEFHYRVFYIKYRITTDNFNKFVNICHKCESRYLFYCKYKIFSLFARNPSKKILKRKYGCIRGLEYPFESWNIKELSE